MRFFKAAQSTGMSTPGIVRIDDDDPDVVRYLALLLPHSWRVVIGKRNGLGEITNELFYDLPNEPWYGLISDDAVPSSREWDKVLIDCAGSQFIAWGADGASNGKKVDFPVLGGDLVRRWKHIILPGLDRLYGDNVITDRGAREGVLRYCPNVKVEHWHWTTGKTPKDDTYVKPSAARDRDTYLQWRAQQGYPSLGVTICCINAGNYCGRGAEYVNNLFDMISRNLPIGFDGKFICFTDDPRIEGIASGIIVKPLPEPGLDGWWNKLALFKDGVFVDGERVWFFDLDTLVMGELDDILEYDGDFATLTDFYHSERVGPAIMAWKVGADSKSIFSEWENKQKPQDGLGDLWWINNLDQGRFARRCDKLQSLFPGKFVSYKVDCHPYAPQGAAVVCFHGSPKPHDCNKEWVAEIWKIGGLTGSSVKTFCNTADSRLYANIHYSSQLPIPWLKEIEAHDKVAVIVGGGPSLKRDLSWIKVRSAQGHTFFALNNAAAFLNNHRICAHWQIVLDARPENAKFVSRKTWMHPASARGYLLASQCDPAVFANADPENTVLWHAEIPGILDAIPGDRHAEAITIGGGTTVLTRAMSLIYALGYRTIHLYGVDSSCEGESHHAYAQATAQSDVPIEIHIDGKTFMAAPWMVAQVYEFQRDAATLAQMGCTLIVHGDGLLPTVAHVMAQAAA